MENQVILDQFITVTRGISGYFAVHMAHFSVNGKPEGFYDNVLTGIGRYKTYDEAVDEAKEWAKAENIRLILQEKEV